MPTITYTINASYGESVSTVRDPVTKSDIQTTYSTFALSCSFHPNGHIISVVVPYTAASLKQAAQDTCKAAYQSAPEIGQSWSQTF